MNTFQIPTTNPRVYKNECMYCPLSLENKIETLYICLQDGHSFCEKCLEKHIQVSQHKHYLILHQLPTPETEKKDKIWGTQTVKETEYFVFNSETKEKQLLSSVSDQQLLNYINYFITCTSVEKKVEIASTRTNAYKHELKQIPREKQIDMNNLCCEVEGCTVTDNLWLNLCDGSVLCGRQQQGMNGFSHALKHYEETKLPLVVKLGTITSDGDADMYDYEHDEDVSDPLLREHLAFYGIDMSKLKKTVLSLDEIAKEQALKMEREIIEEEGLDHTYCFGERRVGFRNTGNTCYVAAALQLLFNIPEVLNYLNEQYDVLIEKHWRNYDQMCICQLSKLARGYVEGCCSERVSEVSDCQIGMAVNSLKTAVGNHYRMYLTNEQQDSEEFLLNLLEIIKGEGYSIIDDCIEIGMRNEINAETLKIEKEQQRIFSLNMDVPYIALAERRHVDVQFNEMINLYGNPQPIEGYRYNGQIINAIKRNKIGKFPKYLIAHVQRNMLFGYMEVRKVDADVHGLESIDLSALKSDGKKGELFTSNTSKSNDIQINQELLESLVMMGFDRVNSEICLYEKKNDIEQAILMLTSGQPIIDTRVKKEVKKEVKRYDEEVAMMIDMGFDERLSRKALQMVDGDVETAIIMVASDEVVLTEEDLVENETNGTETEKKEETKMNEENEEIDPRSGKYELIAYICHLGSNANCGHYVCHVKQGNEWIMFNDNKVFISLRPPFTKASICLYKALD